MTLPSEAGTRNSYSSPCFASGVGILFLSSANTKCLAQHHSSRRLSILDQQILEGGVYPFMRPFSRLCPSTRHKHRLPVAFANWRLASPSSSGNGAFRKFCGLLFMLTMLFSSDYPVRERPSAMLRRKLSHSVLRSASPRFLPAARTPSGRLRPCEKITQSMVDRISEPRL